MDLFRIDGHIHGDCRNLREDPSGYMARMHELGIDSAVLIERGDVVLDAAARLGDFIVPVAQVGMDECSPGDIGRWLSAGCRGIKFIAPHHPYSDDRYWPLYSAVAERGAVAVFHTGYYRLAGREERPLNMQHMRAAEIDVIARRFPDLKIVMAHFSNPWWEEAWKVSWSNPNVYADLSGGTALRRSMLLWAETFAPDGRLMETSLSKLVFASDKVYFAGQEREKVPAYIDFYSRLLDRVGAPPELRRNVWGGTLQRLFGLESPSVRRVGERVLAGRAGEG